MEQMSCNGRLIKPFVRVLARYPQVTPSLLDHLRSAGLSERVGVVEGYATIEHWVRTTGDENIGLKAGASMCLGESGALDFAMHSASTVREGFELGVRHSRLYSDALELTLEETDGRVLLRFDNKLTWPRAAADFTLSAWHNLHVRDQLANTTEVSVMFAHPAPSDTSEYERAFPNATLMFDAPCYGFSFDAEVVDTPLDSGDRALHLAHREHLALLQRQLSPRSFAARVRERLAIELRRGRPTASRVAKQLQVSRRTLVRQLSMQGTSFKIELEQMRRELALEMIVQPDSSLVEITAILGYAQVQAFHRAFRRWTGQTPSQYRESVLSAQRSTATPQVES